MYSLLSHSSLAIFPSLYDYSFACLISPVNVFRAEFDVRDGTGVGYLEMLFRTNFLGILGGGHHARLPSNVACLWDGIKQRFLLEITCASEVKAIRLRRDR